MREHDAEPIGLEHAPGRPLAAISWAPDGKDLSVCIETGEGALVETIAMAIVLEGTDDEQGEACLSTWLSDGSLAVARTGTAAVEIGGEVAVGPSALAALLPSGAPGATVTALGAGGPGLALGVIGTGGRDEEPAAIAVFTETGSPVYQARLPGGALPVAIGLAPDGTALWYQTALRGKGTRLIAIPGGRRLVPFGARWFAWSPSGRYLAAATAEGVEVSTWPDGERVGIVPVNALTLTWTGGGPSAG